MQKKEATKKATGDVKPRPDFITLSVLENETLQENLTQAGKTQVISSLLLDLVIQDLIEHGLLLKQEIAQYREYFENKRKDKRTIFSKRKKKHTTFCIYIPRHFDWLRDKLTPEFLNSKLNQASRSRYFWRLFAKHRGFKLN